MAPLEKPLEKKDTPHRRWNPLLREWVLVSPHRTQRPWQGQVAKARRGSSLQYDPECYLCPGNSRAGGVAIRNIRGRMFSPNDYPALLPDIQQFESDESGLIVARSERGVSRVICFSPHTI